MSAAFVNILLLGLCSNYTPFNGTTEFNCKLKNEVDLKKEILRGKTLKILAYDDPPLSELIQKTNSAYEGRGIAFEVIKTLQNKYGFNYELIKGPKIMGDETTGLFGQIATGEVDMIAGFLPVLPGTHEYITWGTELGQTSYYVLMKRPEDSATGSGLLSPFDKEVWFLILVSLVVVGPVIYFIMGLRAKLCPEENPQTFSLTACIWFVYGALMKQGSTLTPFTDSARMLFATWWIFILILTAFYTANLTAFLTLSLFTLPIKQVEDVAKPPNQWFSAKGGSVEYAIKNKDDGDLNILMKSVEKGSGKFIDINSESLIFSMLYDGWLYLDDWYSLTKLMFDDYKRKTEKGILEKERCTFVLTEKSFLLRSLAFAYPKASNLPDLFNPIVQTFVESGILKHLMNSKLPDTMICPLNLGNKERRLRNSDLLTTYVVVVSGFGCAFVVFCTEIIWRRYLSKNYDWNMKGLSKSYNAIFPFGCEFDKMAIKREQTKINGREYFLITAKGGDKKLIPIRTPSALLFHYGLNYPKLF